MCSRRQHDFESRLFDHLSTPPYSLRKAHYSNPCPKNQASGFLFRQFHDFIHAAADFFIILPPVWPQAPGAVLDTAFRVRKAAAAVFSQGIERTKTEQAAEGIRIRAPVAGEILTFFVLKKIIVRHGCLLHKKTRGPERPRLH